MANCGRRPDGGDLNPSSYQSCESCEQPEERGTPKVLQSQLWTAEIGKVLVPGVPEPPGDEDRRQKLH